MESCANHERCRHRKYGAIARYVTAVSGKTGISYDVQSRETCLIFGKNSAITVYMIA